MSWWKFWETETVDPNLFKGIFRDWKMDAYTIQDDKGHSLWIANGEDFFRDDHIDGKSPWLVGFARAEQHALWNEYVAEVRRRALEGLQEQKTCQHHP